MKTYVLKITKQSEQDLKQYLNKQHHKCLSIECHHKDHEIFKNNNLPFIFNNNDQSLWLYNKQIMFTCVNNINCSNLNEFTLISMSQNIFVVCCGNACSCKKSKVALDLNTNPFITTSNNTTYNLTQTNKYIQKMTLKKELIENCQNEEKKAKFLIHLQKAQKKVSNSLYLELNLITNDLLFNYDVIYLENLGITYKGNFEYKINNFVYSLFRSILVSKAHLLKKEIVFISKDFSSTQICSNCFNTNKIKIMEKVYTCKQCCITLNRDYNAALNIYKQGELINETNN